MKPKVFISAWLKEDKNKNGEHYGRDVYKVLHAIKDIEIVEIENHQKNVWCRDYMPVQRADGKLVQFRYFPGYMQNMKKYEDNFPGAKQIEKELKSKGVDREIISSNIILDGGAIEVLGDQAIVSDRVFKDNYKKYRSDYKQLLDDLKKVLKLKQLIVVPEYPYDFTGHVDGMVRFIDKNTVLINEDPLPRKKDYPQNPCKLKRLEQWHYDFHMVFENVGLKTEKIPVTNYYITRNGNKTSYEGLYINFLKLDDLIIMPSFGKKKEDEKARQILKENYNKKVIPVNASLLAVEWGLINCVTWSY